MRQCTFEEARRVACEDMSDEDIFTKLIANNMETTEYVDIPMVVARMRDLTSKLSMGASIDAVSKVMVLLDRRQYLAVNAMISKLERESL